MLESVLLINHRSGVAQPGSDLGCASVMGVGVRFTSVRPSRSSWDATPILEPSRGFQQLGFWPPPSQLGSADAWDTALSSKPGPWPPRRASDPVQSSIAPESAQPAQGWMAWTAAVQSQRSLQRPLMAIPMGLEPSDSISTNQASAPNGRLGQEKDPKPQRVGSCGLLPSLFGVRRAALGASQSPCRSGRTPQPPRET